MIKRLLVPILVLIMIILNLNLVYSDTETYYFRIDTAKLPSGQQFYVTEYKIMDDNYSILEESLNNYTYNRDHIPINKETRDSVFVFYTENRILVPVIPEHLKNVEGRSSSNTDPFIISLPTNYLNEHRTGGPGVCRISTSLPQNEVSELEIDSNGNIKIPIQNNIILPTYYRHGGGPTLQELPEDLAQNYYDMRLNVDYEVIPNDEGSRGDPVEEGSISNFIVKTEEESYLEIPADNFEDNRQYTLNLYFDSVFGCEELSSNSNHLGINFESVEGNEISSPSKPSSEGYDPLEEIIITEDSSNIILSELAKEKLGVNQLDSIRYEFNIEEGAIISSQDTSLPAIDTGSFPEGSEVKIVNNGLIIGKGGKGGENRGREDENPFPGEDGEDGGDAIWLNHDNVEIVNNARIYSGGGGGGAGGSSEYCVFMCFYPPLADYDYASGGGGGGSAFNGEGGTSAKLDTTGENGEDAIDLNPGEGGSAEKKAGNGGSGGRPGEDGKAGQRSRGEKPRDGGPGGKAGYAIVTNGYEYYINEDSDIKGDINVESNLNIDPIQENTNTFCKVHDIIDQNFGNNKNLKNRLKKMLPEEVQSGSSRVFYQRYNLEGSDLTCRDIAARVSCNDGILKVTYKTQNGRDKNLNFISYINEGNRIFKSCVDLSTLSDEVNEEEINGTNVVGVGEGNFSNKGVLDPESNETYFVNENGTLTKLNSSTIEMPMNKKIRIFKNGVLDREKEIDPKAIAMLAHRVKTMSDQSDVDNFVTDSFNIMTSMDIVKNLTYEPSVNRTRIKIELDNVSESSRNNLTIYQIIPKSIAESSKDINFISDGGGQRFIVDDDPVIGWYFNESDSEEDIEYEVDGESDGGEIIITSEPVLFNEGELIINYRDRGCNAGEIALFEIESLEASRMFEVGSGMLYTLCISHLSETITLDDSGDLDQYILNYDNSSNASVNGENFSNNLTLSVTNSTPIYWDKRIQRENPAGDYSCLGSITNESNSLFGDCGYSENQRIWLHLGNDTIPPHTELDYPVLAHTIRVDLIPYDNVGGAGVDNTYYCIDESGSCSPTTEYSDTVIVTCENDWGCRKYMRYYSTDLEGNIEDIKTTELVMLDKGSACQSSCMAKPSPNRFLKECRNLNGCEYRDLNGDEGETIANRCDMLVEGSYVRYNSQYDVMCPNGPLRQTRFSSDNLDFEESDCSNLVSIPYTAMIEGSSVMVRIITCQDE